MGYPNNVQSFRQKENRSGVSFDSSLKKVLFAEDFEILESEIENIETQLVLSQYARPKYKRAFGSYLSTGYNDLYTVPSGKKAFVLPHYRFFNASASTIFPYIYVDIAGSQYIIYGGSNLSSGDDRVIKTGQGIVLNAGEKIGVNVGLANGLNAFFSVLEFDDSTPLYRADAFNMSSGQTKMYTVPPSKSAKMLSDLDNTSLIGLFNNSIASADYIFYTVPFGGSPGITNQCVRQFSVSNYSFLGLDFFDTLTEDDEVWIETNSANSGQHAWFNYWEFDS